MAQQDKKDDTNGDVNSQAMALAEQLGRIAGMVEGSAEAWLNRASLTEQLNSVRDGAAKLLNSLAAYAPVGTGRRKKGTAKGQRRSTAKADPAHAPGKRRRKPAPSVRGAKKSDQRIPKMRAAKAVRRRRKYA